MPASPFRTWAERPECVVICGGKGTRLGAHAADQAKSMVEVAGRPLVDHLVNSWRPHVGRFLFVANHCAEQLEAHLPTLDIEWELVTERGEGRGIASALLQVAGRVRGDRFVMLLGDCLHAGTWQVTPELEQGVGVWPTQRAQDIHDSYSVKMDEDGRIRKLVEKPRELVNDLCGTGFYFLQRAVFDHIQRTPPSALRGQVEITDVLGTMIDSGLPLHGVTLKGNYINVTYGDDLPRAAAVVAQQRTRC